MGTFHNILTPDDDLQAVLDQSSPGDFIQLSEGDFRVKCTVFVPSLTIRGAGMDKTRIIWDDYANKIHADGKEYNTFRTWTMAVCADHITMEDLAVVNGSLHPETKGQEVALTVYADDFHMKHCRLTSTQDTLFLGPLPKDLIERYDGFLPDHLRRDISCRQYFEDCLIEGELPDFSDTKTKYPLVVSKTMADKLRIHAGDRLFAYFIGDDDVRTRRFTVSAIYQTNMKRFDDMVCLTDLCVTQRLNGWDSLQCTGAEVLVNDFDRLRETNRNLLDILRDNDKRDDEAAVSYTITDIYPQVFSWLELLDINVWIILGLMIAVAGFTMISGLLIIILERTQMIGILKALGARNSTIRHTFLWFAAFIIGRGLLWGNIMGLGIVLIQKYTGVVKLDAQTYYVNEAPMELNLLLIALLNVVTLLVSVFVLVAPSYLVSHIHPARSMHYE